MDFRNLLFSSQLFVQLQLIMFLQTEPAPVIRRNERVITPISTTRSPAKWNKKYITYRVSAYSRQKNISREYIDDKLSKAFQLWEKHADLEFRQSSDFDVDIEIRFEKGDHGDPIPFFDHTLAHAFLPTQVADEPLGGDIHFNDGYSNWMDGTTLLHTAAHEIGHALGMPHSSTPHAIMSPYQGDATMPVILAPEDIEMIQALYGPPRVHFRPPSTFPTLRTQTPTKSTPMYSTTESEQEMEADNEIKVSAELDERENANVTSTTPKQEVIANSAESDELGSVNSATVYPKQNGISVSAESDKQNNDDVTINNHEEESLAVSAELDASNNATIIVSKQGVIDKSTVITDDEGLDDGNMEEITTMQDLTNRSEEQADLSDESMTTASNDLVTEANDLFLEDRYNGDQIEKHSNITAFVGLSYSSSVSGTLDPIVFGLAFIPVYRY